MEDTFTLVGLYIVGFALLLGFFIDKIKKIFL
jgi:hypothetical protein